MLNKANITSENILCNNTETIEKIPEINSRVTGSQTKGQFLKSGVVFPHEDIILRGLEIVKENPSVASLRPDVRKRNIEFNEERTTTFKHKIKILQLSKISMAAIADTYKNKYNINIYIITYNIYYRLLNLAQQLDNSEKIGVVLDLEGGYEGRHVTPVILSKSNNELSIVVLDSVFTIPKIQGVIESTYVKLMQEYGETKCHRLYVEGGRQKDEHSCINDAFIILKDALRKPNLINELFANSEIKQERYHETIKDYQINIAEFPKSLYKSVQNKQWLDKLTPEELQTPLKEVASISTKLATKTLKTHLDKYNCKITAHRKLFIYSYTNVRKEYDIDWIVNFYLPIKGYRMLVKAFQAIDDGSGKVNQERADALMKKYINPSFIKK
jgi:hypothetical protein